MNVNMRVYVYVFGVMYVYGKDVYGNGAYGDGV